MTTKNRPSSGGSLDQLADLVNKAGIRLELRKEKAAAEAPKPAAAEAPEAALPETAPQSSDEELFFGAMDGVQRAAWRHDPYPLSKPAPATEGDPDLEARRLMQQAVQEDSPMTILDHPEYIEGWVGVAGKRYLPKLRNGLYSIQGQIDLHGFNRAEAQIAVEDYIIRMSRFHSCCIKIIHGRGINSPTDRATLKESLQRLLSTRRMSHYVVAYASAPFNDGGVGAVYVLLSRQ